MVPHPLWVCTAAAMRGEVVRPLHFGQHGPWRARHLSVWVGYIRNESRTVAAVTFRWDHVYAAQGWPRAAV